MTNPQPVVQPAAGQPPAAQAQQPQAVLHPAATQPAQPAPTQHAAVLQAKEAAKPLPNTKQGSFISLPTSVKKDMMTKNVIDSIFDDPLNDMFSTPAKPPPKSPAKPPLTHKAAPAHSPITKKPSTGNIDDIFSSPSPTQPPPFVAEPAPPKQPLLSVKQAPKPAQPAGKVPMNDSLDDIPETEPLPDILVASSENLLSNISDFHSMNQSNEEIINSFVTLPSLTPAEPQHPKPAAKELEKVTETFASLSHNDPPAPTYQEQPPVQPVALPAAVVEQKKEAPVPQPVPSSTTISDELLNLPSPCSNMIFVPPRTGGVEETPKIRLMQEKLFLRYVNAYLIQRGVSISDFKSDFANGVFYVILVECVTQIPLSDSLSMYCSITPSSPDQSFCNFYYALLHLYQVQRAMPEINISSLSFSFFFSSSSSSFPLSPPPLPSSFLSPFFLSPFPSFVLSSSPTVFFSSFRVFLYQNLRREI